MALGDISGPMLKANLARDGVNLYFKNDVNDVPLLSLDVNNQYIGLNKEIPTAAIDVDGDTETSSNLTVTTTANIGNFTAQNSSISVQLGDIFVNSNQEIIISNLATDDILISDNVISSYNSSNIELSPFTGKTVELFTNLNITGNLHASGNVQANGNITLGSDDLDNIAFLADVNSDLIPAANNTYSLGSANKKWGSLYGNFLNGQIFVTGSIEVFNVDLANRPGNIFFVAENGDDTNVGDHPHGPFRTIKRALEFSDASINGPVTIHVYPGTYEEELPLIVPTNVTVNGEDIRNVIVKPAAGYEGNDVFLLNGETTIQNLSIKDTTGGYAFRFDTNAVVSSRSPYIQNVTVITATNGGNGALVDGADVDSNSNEASMLFHSCTFITPGTDALVATNGARVEWLNSFTYFANRGIYAYNGTTGHLSSDGSTIKYGAEIRSIGSANVYGTYGVVGDGNSVTVYLINHNFAYIGLGTDATNDKTLTVKANQVVKQNSANIYFSEIDAAGEFAVGDNFFVNQQTGNTSIVISSSSIESLNSLTVTVNNNTTVIDGEKIDVGNFLLSNNLIKTVQGEINFQSATGFITINDTVNFQKNLTITNDLSIDGTLVQLGNEFQDTVTFAGDLDQNLLLTNGNLYNLGSAAYKWKNLYISDIQVSDILIRDNFIETVTGNTNLELYASGTGKLYIEQNNVLINNDLTVSGTTDISDSNISSDVTHIGNRSINLTSLSLLNGNVLLTNNLNVNSDFYTTDLDIQGNLVKIKTTNTNLQLEANGSGKVRINDYAKINKTLTSRILSAQNIILTDSNLTFDKISTSTQILIDDNYITTQLSNSNLELRASASGYVQFEDILIKDNTLSTYTDNINLKFGNILTINSTSSLFLPKGTITERTLAEGHIRFNTTDEKFEGFGSGIITFNGVYSDDRTTSVSAHKVDNIINFTVDNNLIGFVDSNEFNVLKLTVDDIEINDNKIQTTISNSNLDIKSTNVGINISDIIIAQNDIINSQATPLLLNNNFGFVDTVGFVPPVGNSNDRGTINEVGELRYNVDINDLEIFDGSNWVNAALGGSPPVTEALFEDLIDEWTLILG